MASTSKNRRIGPHGAEAMLPYLPEEIIVEILSRLPVKYLCRFRCVCKSWLILISSPEFAKIYLNLAVQKKTIRRRLVMSSHSLYSGELESKAKGYSRIVAVELDHPYKDDSPPPRSSACCLQAYVNERNWIEILGSCHGLVCLGIDFFTSMDMGKETFFLLNPSTREFKLIPIPSGSFSGKMVFYVHGFGYDSVHDDYKIVRIYTDVVSVYSLRSDSWRIIGNFPHVRSLINSGVYTRGAIHWAVTIKEDGNSRNIVAVFDLAKEIFSEMAAPDDANMSSDTVVGVLNERLCLLHSRSGLYNYFWMMQEYDANPSWIKLSISLRYRCMKPLCVPKPGEGLLLVDGKLVWYNFRDNKCYQLPVHGMPTGVGFQADTYWESVVSPGGYSQSKSKQVTRPWQGNAELYRIARLGFHG